MQLLYPIKNQNKKKGKSKASALPERSERRENGKSRTAALPQKTTRNLRKENLSVSATFPHEYSSQY
jgi:hypothetical protein